MENDQSRSQNETGASGNHGVVEEIFGKGALRLDLLSAQKNV